MVYQWAAGTRSRIDAQVAGDCLESLRQRLSGEIRPADVVNEARSNRSPIHDGFEWDDARAAQANRIDQAKYMLRHINVEIQPTDDQDPTFIRAFCSVEPAEPRYVSITDALKDPISRQELVAKALAEAFSWRRRYQQLDELARVFRALDEV